MVLTKKDLKEIKDTVNKIVIDASHTILSGVQTMFDKHEEENKRDFKNLETKLSTRIDGVEKNLKDEIDGLKAEFSLQVSKKEFNQLEAKVDRFHPTS